MSLHAKKQLNKAVNIDNYDDVTKLISTKSELDYLTIHQKAKKYRKELKTLYIEELNKPIETKLASNLNDESDFDDDLSYKEEVEGPKNDYNQHFVDTGQRAQNFIRDPGLVERFEEYPKLRELIKLKDELISKTNMPTRPMYIKSTLLNRAANSVNSSFSLMELTGSEFDVILIEPPLHEYRTSNGVHFNKYYSWDEIKQIDVGSITSQRSFIFLWCGSGDGLDRGRECLKHWGFRRCEDICWIKTNKNSATKRNLNIDCTGAILQRTKEHCLMGIKGTVRRSIDSNFIHTNIDIDLIITEEFGHGNADKPEEIFHIIEHFCLGKRRLYLFGRDSTIRHGWLTVGPDLSDTNFDKEVFRNSFDLNNNGNLTGSSEKIEMLRPKTPPPKMKPQMTNILEQVVSAPPVNLNNNTIMTIPSIQIINDQLNTSQNEFEFSSISVANFQHQDQSSSFNSQEN